MVRLACHVLLGKATLDRDQVDAELLTRSARWLRHLRASNARSGALDPASLRFATSYVWLLLCRAALPKLGAPGKLVSQRKIEGLDLFRFAITR